MRSPREQFFPPAVMLGIFLVVAAVIGFLAVWEIVTNLTAMWR